ncbi:MAG: RNA polymerase sigma-I factor [Clostridiales bacterium]|nr:RNA polymerase sigma-I factor [Eubacteriales bacterium]MDH7567126.1 RNA polymerase sigma-I factor [Clostridiales bacterium]
MTILHLFDKFRQNSEPIRDTLQKIKSGDNLLKEGLINDYKPFVIKVVSKTTGKYVDLENSEEFSIGLIAFNEAIECYNESKNTNFFSFAETVIKRRVIDYTRSNYKNNKVYPFTYFDIDENDSKNSFEEKYLKVDASSQFDNIETKEEIALFTKRLGEYGITLKDLVESAPKHMDSKRLSIKIARVLSENKDLFEKLEKKKNIPMVDLLKLVDVNPKTIERNRKFIIAVCFILNSNLDVLQGYVENVEKGGNTHD